MDKSPNVSASKHDPMTADERVLICDVAMVTDSGCPLPTDDEFCHSSECRCHAVNVTVLLLL